MTDPEPADIIYHDDVPGVCFFMRSLAGIGQRYFDQLEGLNKLAWMFAFHRAPVLYDVADLVDSGWDGLLEVAGE